MVSRRWIAVTMVAALIAPAMSAGAASTHDVNGLVVFSSDGEIYVMRQDGSNRTRLVNDGDKPTKAIFDPSGDHAGSTLFGTSRVSSEPSAFMTKIPPGISRAVEEDLGAVR